MSSVDNSIGQGGDFAKGPAGTSVYDTSPSGLGMNPTYLASSAATAVSSNVSGTSSIGHATRTTSVSTSGTTYGTGADLLASAISFTADGTSDYAVTMSCPSFHVTGAVAFALTIDGSQSSSIASPSSANTGGYTVRGIISAPSAGTHTVNIRMWTSANTATATAGVGGSGTDGPILVTVDALS